MSVPRSERFSPRLPAELTSFVGRRRELGEVKQLLSSTRLLTLTGPGGVGKTRLALRAAADLARAFKDGAAVVELAALEDPALLATFVARSMGLREQSARWLPATLAEYLADKQLLLVLDNCEHLLHPCAVLAETLLRGAAALRILITSREALNIDGETTLAVPSLSLPEPGHLPSLERLSQYEAVTLFYERARAIDPSFRVTVGNRGQVVELCQRLDGIPLAIELAAVRLKVLSLDQVVERLDDQFRLLTHGSRTALPRHQTLRATIEWSWNLLANEERTLWRRLSVFARDFDLDGVAAVCSDEGLAADDILDPVSSLVDKSLLSRTEVAGAARYSMLETLRRFAREQAEVANEIEELSDRHLAWYAELASRARDALMGAGQRDWLERLEIEFANLQAALDFAADHDEFAPTGLMMIDWTRLFWQTHGHLTEGRHWVTLLLERATAPTWSRLVGLRNAAWLALALGDADGARPALQEGLTLGERLGHQQGLADILVVSGQLAHVEGDADGAIHSLRDAERIYARLGDTVRRGAALQLLGAALLSKGDMAAGETATEEAIRIARETSNGMGLAAALLTLGAATLMQGQPARGEDILKQALPHFSELGIQPGMGLVFEALATAAAKQGQFDRAARLLGVVDRVWATGAPRSTAGWRTMLSEVRVSLRTQLGEKQFERARMAGEAMKNDAAVAFALEETASVAGSEPTTRDRGGLSQREFEVATLVARGMSNKQIASKLLLSERTIDHHVAHILDKLGFNARAQVAAWATEGSGDDRREPSNVRR